MLLHLSVSDPVPHLTSAICSPDTPASQAGRTRLHRDNTAKLRAAGNDKRLIPVLTEFSINLSPQEGSPPVVGQHRGHLSSQQQRDISEGRKLLPALPSAAANPQGECSFESCSFLGRNHSSGLIESLAHHVRECVHHVCAEPHGTPGEAPPHTPGSNNAHQSTPQPQTSLSCQGSDTS